MTLPDLTDGVIRLRPPTLDDVPAITEACQDPEIPRWTEIPTPYTDDDARRWVQGLHETSHPDPERSFLTVEASTGALLGAVGLRINERNGVGEIGYWVKREARGRGVATRAVRLLSVWGFAAMGLSRIELLSAVQNAPSRRVAERAGFTLEGILRSRMARKDGRMDVALYSLLPADLA